MAYLFVGGEDIDFVFDGTCGVSTNASYFRAGYARCAISVGISYALNAGAKAPFAAPSGDFWIRANCAVSGGSGAFNDPGYLPFVYLFDGTTPLFVVRRHYSNGTLQLAKATTPTGGETVLATGEMSTNALRRFDVRVKLGPAGEFAVYQDQNLAVAYSGDMTGQGGRTTADHLRLRNSGNNNGNAVYHWSEVVVAERDTRTLSLRTLAPESAVANGWASGAVGDVNETTANDATALHSDAAGQEARFALPALPSDFLNPAVRAVMVSARASASAGGPQSLRLGTKTSAGTGLAAATPLTTGWERHTALFETDPADASPWTPARVDAAELVLTSAA